MRLKELKNILQNLETVSFQLPNGEFVPKHFHVTEVGKVEKNFIDCGGKIRNESVVNFQLWFSTDEEHRLGAQKLLKIIQLSEDKIGLQDAEIEVEYQSDTIGKYGLKFNDGVFQLDIKMTDCLAQDKCGIPQQKPKIRISADGPTCAPGSGCC